MSSKKKKPVAIDKDKRARPHQSIAIRSRSMVSSGGTRLPKEPVRVFNLLS